MQITERARDALAELQRAAAPVLALLAPQRCGACGVEGALLCFECCSELGLTGAGRVEQGAAPSAALLVHGLVRTKADSARWCAR